MSGTVHTWSPSTFGSQANIRRCFVQIPKNQQPLLDCEDAWSATNRNVPREVLEQLKEALAAKPQVTQPQRETPPLPRPATPSQQRCSQARPEPSPGQSTPGSEITWSPSQTCHSPPMMAEEEAEEEPQLPSPPSQKFPPRPPAPKVLHRVTYMPSSSSQPSIQWEVEVPKAITHVPSPVDHPTTTAVTLAPLDPTPPSGQIIPGTIADGTTPVKPRGVKRQRLMKDVAGRFSPESTGVPGQMISKPIPVVSEDRLSPFITSSSFPARIPLTGTSSDTQLITSPITTFPSWSPTDQAPSRFTVITAPLQKLDSTPEWPPPNGPASQFPYTAFTVAYPDLECSLNSFVRGVMCLRDLQERRALPQFLYDDFIRVFCGDYLDYIRQLPSGGSTRPLSAIQWYNEHVSSPLYMKGVLTKRNVDGVLEKHIDELRTIREGLGARLSPQSAERPHSEVMVVDTPARKNEAAPSTPNIALPSPVVHTAELASDPIEIVENTQPRRERRLPDSGTAGSSCFSKLKQTSRPSTQTPEPGASQKDIEAKPSPLPAQVATPKQITSQNTRQRPVHNDVPTSNHMRESRSGSVMTDISFIQQTTPKSKPEQVGEQKVFPRPPSTAMSRKSKSRRSFIEFLESTIGSSSSSTPGGPAVR